MSVRFIAFLGTRDEVELIGAAISHLRRIGVELIVVTDYGSSDGTLDVISEEEAHGDVWLVRLPPEEFLDPSWTDRAVTQARSAQAEWALFLDTDEFWLPATASLHDIPELRESDIISVPRFDVAVARGQGSAAIDLLASDAYGRLLLHADMEEAEMYPKVMVRPEAIARLHEGDHGVDAEPGQRWRRTIAANVLIAHLQFTTLPRFERKIANIRQIVAQHPRWFEEGWGSHWTDWLRQVDEGRMAELFEAEFVDPDRLPELRTNGSIGSAAEVLALRRTARQALGS